MVRKLMNGSEVIIWEFPVKLNFASSLLQGQSYYSPLKWRNCEYGGISFAYKQTLESCCQHILSSLPFAGASERNKYSWSSAIKLELHANTLSNFGGSTNG